MKNFTNKFKFWKVNEISQKSSDFLLWLFIFKHLYERAFFPVELLYFRPFPPILTLTFEMDNDPQKYTYTLNHYLVNFCEMSMKHVLSCVWELKIFYHLKGIKISWNQKNPAESSFTYNLLLWWYQTSSAQFHECKYI